MYTIAFVEGFDKYFKKIIKKNPILTKKFYKTIDLLALDPNYPSLNSHKVDIIGQEDVWVSRISGDIRLVWFYDGNQKLIINCIKIGTHNGANQIYNQKSS